MTHLGFSRNQPLSFWGPLDSLASFGSPELEMLNARFWMRCRRSVLGGWFGWSYLLSLKNMSMVNRLLWNPQRKEPSENHWKLLSKNESLSTTFSLSLSTISCGARCVGCVAKVIGFKSNGFLLKNGGHSHMIGAQRPECGHCCRETWENGTGSLGVVWVVGIQQDVWHWIKSLSLF